MVYVGIFLYSKVFHIEHVITWYRYLSLNKLQLCHLRFPSCSHCSSRICGSGTIGSHVAKRAWNIFLGVVNKPCIQNSRFQEWSSERGDSLRNLHFIKVHFFFPPDFVLNQNCLPIMKSRRADINGSFDLRWVVDLQSLNSRSDVSPVARSKVGKMIKIDLVDESLVSSWSLGGSRCHRPPLPTSLHRTTCFQCIKATGAAPLGVQVVAPGKTKSFAVWKNVTYVAIGQCGFMNLLSINPLRIPTKLYWFIWMSFVLPVGWQSFL